jgi:hypothetical protein
MIPKERLIDSANKPLTQSLFLEIGYTDLAVYTLKERDYTYEGKLYPSLKALYLEMEDVTEYEFATQHLLGWKHWQRLCANKQIGEYIAEWREELECKMRAKAAKQMMVLAEQGSYQASKWLADRGWDTRGAGRPTKVEKTAQRALLERAEGEYSADILRLLPAKQG